MTARAFFVLINLLFWTTVLGILCLLVGLIDWSGKLIGFIARIWASIILWSGGVSYRVIGREFLEPKKHYFFAGNHESAMDIPLSWAGIPYQLVSIAKIELLKIPIMGWAMVLAKHIFVDRSNHKKALESLELAKVSLQKHPRSIMLFPEGTRSIDGEIHQFKKGGLALAVQLGMPVVPVAMCGTRDIVKKKSKRLNPGYVELRFGEPINTAEWEDKDPVEFANYVRDRVIALKQAWIEGKKSSNY